MSNNNYEVIFEKIESAKISENNISKLEILRIMEETEEISNLIDFIKSDNFDDYSSTITSS